jgi:uncharacterized protein (DUF58 family)
VTARGWILLACAVAAFVAAPIIGIGLLATAASILIVLVITSVLWAHGAARGLSVTHQPAQACVGLGATLAVTVVVQAHRVLPRPWIEVIDHSTLSDHPVARVDSLLLARTSRHAWAVVCRRRGAFRLGPTTVLIADPFGLTRIRRDLAARHDVVLVTPVAARWPAACRALLVAAPDARRSRWRNASEPAASVRHYRVGDPLRSIHWRSSAHRGRLMSRELDAPHDGDLVIMLDHEAAALTMLDPPVLRADGTLVTSSDDLMALAAATVLDAALSQRRDIRLMHTGTPPVLLARLRHAGDGHQAQAALARYQSAGAAPLAHALPATWRALGRHGALVLVTAARGADWAAPLCHLARGGQSVVVIHLTTQQSADPAALALLRTHHVPTILLDASGDAPRLAGDPAP